MKKLVSRFMAVLMAMTMILSMSMTAFAAEASKGTLTVNNTVEGKTLDLYQIFTATKNEAGNVAYTLNSAYEGFFQSKISGASTLTGEALSEKAYNYVKDQVGTDGSNGAAFAKDILDWILKNATTVATTHTTANTTADTTVINNLDYGYYVVYPLGATDTSTAPGNEKVKSVASLVTVEDEAAVYNLSNTEFTMYQVGIYKKNSWVLETEFAKSGVIFDFDDSSAQAEAAKKLEKYVQDNNIKGMSGKTNSDGEVMYRNLEKGVYLFVQIHTTQISNQVYQSEPFIITVPGNYDGQIIWNVTAEPKFKNESIPPITTNTPPITTNTPPVSEEPSGDNSSHTSNVKTGDDTNVIMWLSLMGISLVIFSICKRKVHK